LATSPETANEITGVAHAFASDDYPAITAKRNAKTGTEGSNAAA